MPASFISKIYWQLFLVLGRGWRPFLAQILSATLVQCLRIEFGPI